MKSLVLVFMILSSTFAANLISQDEIEALFKRAFNHQLTEEDNKTLQEVVEILRQPEYVSSRDVDVPETRATLDCIICRSAFAALIDVIQNGQEDGQIIGSIEFFCTVLGIESEAVCTGVSKLNMPIISYIIRNTPEATPAAFCALVNQNAHNPDACPSDDPRLEWQVELPEPSQIESNNSSSESVPFTFAILTDAHLDPLYEAFGVADCGEPVCCRKGQRSSQRFVYNAHVDESVVAESIVREGREVKLDLDVADKIKSLRSGMRTMLPEARSSAPAGYWGDYRNCDTPMWAFDDVIDRIAEAHQNVDVVYYIGDTIDHGVWETTYELIDEMNLYLVNKIRSTFGDNVPVVPVIGNHESQPTNQFAPSYITGEGLNTTWLYEALANKWGYYLTEEARERLRTTGDFSILVKPGLRAISMNNNVAYRFNWWIAYDPTDMKNHLEWLVEELYKAEQAGEKVHLLLHIPPGVHDLTLVWTREYNRIVNRFSSTIVAEFNGHTHSDEFKIFYNDEGYAINVAWGAGSATSYSFYNLNYKIASIDSQTFEPLNIQNYVYNLTEANLTPNRRPHWFLLYDMQNTFGLSDITARSMDNLVYRMVSEEKHLLDIYSAFFSKLSDSRWSWCGVDCKLDTACKTVVTVLWERQRCQELIDLYYST